MSLVETIKVRLKSPQATVEWYQHAYNLSFDMVIQISHNQQFRIKGIDLSREDIALSLIIVLEWLHTPNFSYNIELDDETISKTCFYLTSP